MTLRLPNHDTVPPGGWRYLVPETGKIVKGPSMMDLIRAVRDHMHGNGYTMPHDIAVKIEDYMCEQMPNYCGNVGFRSVPSKTNADPKNPYHTFHHLMQCLKTLISHRAGGRQSITPQIATTRAQDCVGCVNNVKITECSTCNSTLAKRTVQKLAGSGVTEFDSQLQACAICHCDNRAKVWTSHDAIWKHMPQAQKDKLPENCWIFKEAKNV